GADETLPATHPPRAAHPGCGEALLASPAGGRLRSREVHKREDGGHTPETCPPVRSTTEQARRRPWPGSVPGPKQVGPGWDRSPPPRPRTSRPKGGRPAVTSHHACARRDRPGRSAATARAPPASLDHVPHPGPGGAALPAPGRPRRARAG